MRRGEKEKMKSEVVIGMNVLARKKSDGLCQKKV